MHLDAVCSTTATSMVLAPMSLLAPPPRSGSAAPCPPRRFAHKRCGTGGLQCLVPSAPIPKFASVRRTLECELRNHRSTRNIDIFECGLEFEVPTRACGDLIGTSNSPH